METKLDNHDWNKIDESIASTTPYNYAVIDNFLTSAVVEEMRQALLENKCWQYRNWTSKELNNRRPEIPGLDSIVDKLKAELPNVFKGLELVNHWAFLHQQNAGLETHSDNGSVTVNLWLTPDEYNLEPDTGGLIFYDVKRSDDMFIHEFNVADYTKTYLAERTKGKSLRVSYKFNRALIFDSRTFHASDKMNFVAKDTSTYRLNLSLIFDKKVDLDARYVRYGIEPRNLYPHGLGAKY